MRVVFILYPGPHTLHSNSGKIHADWFLIQKSTGVLMVDSADPVCFSHMTEISHQLLRLGTADAIFRLCTLWVTRLAGGRTGEPANATINNMAWDSVTQTLRLIWPQDKTDENKNVLFVAGRDYRSCMFEMSGLLC